MRPTWRQARLAVALLFTCVPLLAKEPPSRPHILGIAQVQIFVTNLPASRDFYSKALNQSHDCNWCEEEPGPGLSVNVFQGIALSLAPSPTPANLIGEIAFATDDLATFRRYLAFHKIAISKPNKPKENYVTVLDPEGHRIAFVERPASVEKLLPTYVPAIRIIHIGFIVHERAAEDHFYKDILGFHVYWHGGMKDSETDWVDMQVPDGTDWIEYMLNVSPDTDQREQRMLNHIALGVENLKAVTEQLRDDRAVSILDEPEIGRDGKSQLNLYDPDRTRVEFMEFKPVQKPCCADYTGRHPGQKR